MYFSLHSAAHDQNILFVLPVQKTKRKKEKIFMKAILYSVSEVSEGSWSW